MFNINDMQLNVNVNYMHLYSKTNRRLCCYFIFFGQTIFGREKNDSRCDAYIAYYEAQSYADTVMLKLDAEAFYAKKMRDIYF